MKIVMTGATGFLGGYIAKRLTELHQVWCIVRKDSIIQDLSSIPVALIYSDRYDNLYDELQKVKPDLVIHLAGIFLGEHNRDNIEGMLEANLKFTCVFWDAAFQAGCKNFINTGTYWQNYLGETYNPVNLYAATKQAAEDLLLYYIKVKKSKAITMQIFDSYGPNDKRNKVLNLVAKLQNGDEIDMSQGEQKLYFCYVEDIVSAYERAIELVVSMDEGEYHKYAIRSKDPISLRTIIDEYLQIAGKDIKCNWGKRSYREREIMNPDGIGEPLPGWEAKYTLQQGLQKYICS